jgi:hypothetical protein
MARLAETDIYCMSIHTNYFYLQIKNDTTNNKDSITNSGLQIYAINERMKMALPPLDSPDKRHDFSHVIDFCTNLRSLEIVGSNIPLGKSTIIPNQYAMDLSSFKSLNDLSLKLVNLDKLKEVGNSQLLLTFTSTFGSGVGVGTY